MKKYEKSKSEHRQLFVLSIKNLLLVFLLLPILSGCGPIESGIHFFQDKLFELNMGKPVTVLGVSKDKYAYNCLNEQEQIVYDQIYDCIYAHDEAVLLSTKSAEDMSKVYDFVTADHPEVFWVSGYRYEEYSSGEYVTGIVFHPGYTMDKAKRDIIQQRIDKVISDWLSPVQDSWSDYDKSKYIYEKLINEVDYDTESEDNQSIISVFLNKKTVCQGYACAASVLFERLGIESTVVSGKANNEAHAWNLLCLDGGYYYFDVTWGNSSFQNGEELDKMIDYGFLNITTDELLLTHEIEDVVPMPYCVNDEDNFFVKEGLFFENYDENRIGKVVSEGFGEGKESISLKFSQKDDYLMAIDHLLTKRKFYDYCPGADSIAYLENNDKNVLTLKFIYPDS